jgi:lysophospholipase L1-like esterase
MNSSKPTRPLELVAKTAVSALLTVLLLAAIEFSAGFFVLRHDSGAADDRIHAIKGDAVSTTLAYLWLNPTPLREDPYLLWSNQPNATRTRFVDPQAFGSTTQWTIENNTQGFRGPELRQDSLVEEAYRVLCIGDSVTFGFNGDQDDTYPAKLSRALRRIRPNKNIEVINAGVPGWSWLQGVRFLEMRGMALEPDLVIMAHGVNDQLMQATITDAERFEHADDPYIMRLARIRLWAAETNIYRLLEQQSTDVPPPSEPSPGCLKQIETYGKCRRVAPDQIESAVVRAGQLADSGGFDLLILNLDFLKTRAATAARRATQAEGIIFVNLVHRMDALRSEAQRQRSDELGLAPSAGTASRRTRRSPQRRNQVIFRVQTPDAAADYGVRGFAPYSEEFEFDIPLNDQGRSGDEHSGDGVYTATLTLPPGIDALSFMFFRGKDPEFKPLPPSGSTFGDRNLLVDGNLTTPVFRFAERFMMAERTHPNADGYEMIADAVALKIRKLPSFIRP